MNRTAFFLVVVAALGVTSFGAAQNTAPQTAKNECCAAVVDMVRIFNECAQIKDLNDKMREESEQYGKEAAQRRKTIEDKQMELTAFAPGTPDHEARRKQLVRANIEANVWLKVTEQAIDQQKFDWTRTLYEKAVAETEHVAKERGFHVVLQRSEFKPGEIEQSVQALRRVLQDRIVIYNAAELDITEAIIHRLDAAYKAGGGKKQLGSASPLGDK